MIRLLADLLPDVKGKTEKTKPNTTTTTTEEINFIIKNNFTTGTK